VVEEEEVVEEVAEEEEEAVEEEEEEHHQHNNPYNPLQRQQMSKPWGLTLLSLTEIEMTQMTSFQKWKNICSSTTM